MAHFIGKLQGARGTASRLGTKSSGISAAAQGWDIGGRIECNHMDGTDYVTLFLTHGSNNPGNAQCLGMFRIAADGTFEQLP